MSARELTGRRAVVVGRSTVVGKPLALLLLARDATVTVCHSRTAELSRLVVLNYDHDFDTVARASGQPAVWVAKPGSAK